MRQSSIEYEIPSILAKGGFTLDKHAFRYRADNDVYPNGRSGSPVNRCLDEIKARSIWHSTIGALNDPFEIFAQKNLDEFKSMPMHKKMKLFVLYAKQQKIQGVLAASPDVLQTLYYKNEEGIKNAVAEVYRGNSFEKYIAEIRNMFAISCFTSVCDSRLMWGYYCNGLSGVCLIYNKDRLLKNKIELQEVSYINGPYKVNLLDFVFNYEDEERTEILTRMVKTKHIDWAHECEYRSVTELDSDESGVGRLITLDENCIDGIIIGKKVRAEVKEQLRILARRNRIKVYMADVDYQNFRVNIYQ